MATACGPLLGRVAFEDAPFELWIRDADGRLILENAAARGWGNVIGLRTEESPVAAEVLPAWLEANRRAYAGGYSRDGASAGDRRLGGEITLELALTVACV